MLAGFFDANGGEVSIHEVAVPQLDGLPPGSVLIRGRLREDQWISLPFVKLTVGD